MRLPYERSGDSPLIETINDAAKTDPRQLVASIAIGYVHDGVFHPYAISYGGGCAEMTVPRVSEQTVVRLVDILGDCIWRNYDGDALGWE